MLRDICVEATQVVYNLVICFADMYVCTNVTMNKLILLSFIFIKYFIG